MTVRGLSESSPSHTTPLPKDLLGDYRFDGDGSDASHTSPPFVFKGVSFKKGTLYLDGRYEHGPRNGYRAVADVPGLTYDAFTISLEFNPIFCGEKEGFLPRLLGREHTDDIVIGGTSHRWFVLGTSVNRDLGVFFNNMDDGQAFPNVRVKENRWNRVVCCVDLKKSLVRTFFNGTRLEDIHLPPDFVLDVHPSDKDEQLTFTNYSDGSAFYGYVDNLRIWGRALEDEEVAHLPFDHPIGQRSRPSWPGYILLVLAVLLSGLGLHLHWKRKTARDSRDPIIPTP